MQTPDWNKAPEGATHYNGSGVCICPWLKEDAGKYYYYQESAKQWIEYHAPYGDYHFLTAVQRPEVPKFPEPGTTCEVRSEEGVWLPCFIIGMDSEGYCTHEILGTGDYEGDNDPLAFRPTNKERATKVQALVDKGLSREDAMMAYDFLQG